MPVTRRALYVTPFALAPRTEGHRKRMAMTFDRLLGEGFQVDVLFISREYDWSALFNADRYRELQSLGDLAHFVHAATPGPPTGEFYEVDEWWPPQATEYCQWLFSNNGYELVFCNYIFMSRVFEFCERSTCKILDTHDVFADRHKLLLANDLSPEFFYTNKRNEAVGLDRAHIAIAIKEEEAGYFRHVTDADVITLPYVENAPEAERMVGRDRAGGPVRFGFFGSKNSINVRNIMEFLKHLEAHAPDGGYPFEFWLYGSLCARIKGRLPGYVRLGGMVDTVEEFYRNVDCVVNPQYFSTGLKIKIAEALAYGAPLISHRHSFEGFGEPLDPAHDCSGFDDVFAAMMAIVGDDTRLCGLKEATLEVQRRQILDRDVQWARIFDRVAARSFWIYFLVDVGCFDKDRFYRHIVEMTFVAFARTNMICLVGDREDDRDSPWRLFKGRANRFAHGMVEGPAEADAIVMLFDDPRRWSGAVNGEPRVVLFEDAARMAAGFASPDERAFSNAVGNHWIVVRSEGARPAPGRPGTPVLVNYFRWMPWDMTVSAAAGQFETVPEVWLLIPTEIGAGWPRLIEKRFTGRRIRYFGDGGVEGIEEAVGGAAELVNLVFTQKMIPEVVICLTHDQSFSAMKAWFAGNGVTVRDFAHYLGRGPAPTAVEILGLQKVSEFIRVPDRGTLGQTVSSAWEGSGWHTLAIIVREWTGQPDPA